VTVDGGYVIDVARDDVLIEIQTGNFSGIKAKLAALVQNHPVRLVYPIAREKWLFKPPREGWDGPRRRKSPKRGRAEEVFAELVSFPALLRDDHFSLDVVMIQEEEVRRYQGEKYWYKNGWVTVRRKLLDVVERSTFAAPRDFAVFVPPEIASAFTTADLAEALEMPRWLAQKMAYCLREMGMIVQVGKRGRAYLYQRA
jgi:hypothetical protein